MAWIKLASLRELSPGSVRGFKVGGTHVAVSNVDGSIYATDNVCTHAFALLSDGYLEGDRLECPLHQGIFCVRDGKALEGPVNQDLRTFPVRVDDGDVYVDL